MTSQEPQTQGDEIAFWAGQVLANKKKLEQISQRFNKEEYQRCLNNLETAKIEWAKAHDTKDFE